MVDPVLVVKAQRLGRVILKLVSPDRVVVTKPPSILTIRPSRLSPIC